MRRKSDTIVPEWARKIEDMRQTRKLSQEGFGSRVGVSAMAVSRWERGVAEPTGETYIRLGNLADAPCAGSSGSGLACDSPTSRECFPRRIAVLPKTGSSMWRL